MFDFAVIGAGVVGGMVARELTKYTSNVCILEKGSDVALGATRANSAIEEAPREKPVRISVLLVKI